MSLRKEKANGLNTVQRQYPYGFSITLLPVANLYEVTTYARQYSMSVLRMCYYVLVSLKLNSTHTHSCVYHDMSAKGMRLKTFLIFADSYS